MVNLFNLLRFLPIRFKIFNCCTAFLHILVIRY
jgi:hypothetical protein